MPGPLTSPEILAQPDSLRLTAQTLADAPFFTSDLLALCSKNAVERIILTAAGSSFHALYPLYLRLTSAGHFCQMVEASEAIHYLSGLFTSNTLTVAVSPSGQDSPLVEILSGLKPKGPVLGITSDPDSTLAAASSILCKIGPDDLSTLAALHWLGAVFLNEKLSLTHQHLNEAASAVERYLDQWKPHADSLQQELEGVEQILLAGCGYSLATTGMSPLILPLPCQGIHSAHFPARYLETLSASTLTCICLGDPLTASQNQSLFETTRRKQAKSFLIGTGSDYPPFALSPIAPALLPILEILPVQLLALAAGSLHPNHAATR